MCWSPYLSDCRFFPSLALAVYVVGVRCRAAVAGGALLCCVNGVSLTGRCHDVVDLWSW